MSDSSNKFLPDDEGSIKPIEQALGEAQQVAGDQQLVDKVKEFRVEGTVPPHAVEQSVKAAVEIVHPKPAAVKARRKGEIEHRPVVPILVSGRSNTEPSSVEPETDKSTYRGLGPTIAGPDVSHPDGEPKAEPKIHNEAVASSDQASTTEPITQPTLDTPAEMKLQKAGRNAALMGFSAAQAELESQLDGRIRRQLFVDRETVERDKLDPTSDAYLLIAERCLEVGCDLSKDQHQAERDREAVYAKRATRGAVEDDKAPPRKNTGLIVGALLLLGLIIAGGFYLRNSGDRAETTQQRASGAPITKAVSAALTTTDLTPTATNAAPMPTQTAVATTAPTLAIPTPTMNRSSEVVQAPPPAVSAVPVTPPIVHSSSAKPPATATPAPTATTSFTAKWITP